MKRKKLIIIVSSIFIVVIGIIGIYLWMNRTMTKITLEINPSIEIRLDKNNKVKKVVALNNDAKDIVKDIKDNDLSKVISNLYETITTKYKDEGTIDMLFHSDGKLSNEEIEKYLGKEIKEEYGINIIRIDEISKEAKEIARKYKISETKAAYINEITKKHKDIPIKELVNNSIRELDNSLNTGLYCTEEGYTLDGEFCVKEISREKTTQGKICPEGYIGYNGTCYRHANEYHNDNLECPEGFEELNEKECISKNTYKPFIECNDNERRNDEKQVCIKDEPYADMVEICRITRETDLLMDHKCYGPKPTINGGCLDNDVIINGGCVDLNRYYEAEWECPDGALNSQEYAAEKNYKCTNEVEVEPKKKTCNSNDKLKDNMCYAEEKRAKQYETYCKEGTLIEKDKCLILDDTTDFIDGTVCESPNSKMVNDTCIIYEIMNAERG